MYENFSNICTINKENLDDVSVLVLIQKGVYRKVSLKSLIEDSIVIDKHVDIAVNNTAEVETMYPKIETANPTVTTVYGSSCGSVSNDIKSETAEQSIEDKAIDYIEHTSRGKKPRIDYGKLEALKKAGWPVKEIALELKCTPGAVYNYLKKHPIN